MFTGMGTPRDDIFCWYIFEWSPRPLHPRQDLGWYKRGILKAEQERGIRQVETRFWRHTWLPSSANHHFEPILKEGASSSSARCTLRTHPFTLFARQILFFTPLKKKEEPHITHCGIHVSLLGSYKDTHHLQRRYSEKQKLFLRKHTHTHTHTQQNWFSSQIEKKAGILR